MDYELTTWRVIEHTPANGAWNMAVDEAILESVFTGDSPPTLRLYAWEPPCLSLGLAQPFSDVDTQALSSYGWDVVRRPTGGRAILHTDELTYSVTGPDFEPRLKGGVLESYLRLSKALIAALEILGLQPQANKDHSRKKPDAPNPVCFEVPSKYEITVNGRKLIGSAQARRKEGILQHGTLPLGGDLSRIVHALRFSEEAHRGKAKQELLAHATTLEDVLDKRPTWQAASSAFQEAFEKTLNLKLINGNLSEIEKDRAGQLMQEKYANPTWTERI